MEVISYSQITCPQHIRTNEIPHTNLFGKLTEFFALDSINQTDVIGYYEYAQNLLSKHSQLNLQNFSMALLSSKPNKVLERENAECELKYKSDSLEIRMWSLALVSMSWIIENLKRKTQNGHCGNTKHEHGEREPRNCKSGYDFHLQMYTDCLSSFRDVINVAEKNPPKVLTNH